MRIPSVSSDPGRVHDVRLAADWLAARLRSGGADVSLRGSTALPVVVGKFRAVRPDAATVLVYGHYDVQPAGRGWTSDPFEPLVRDGRLVGRGASDDKGQLLMHVAAAEAWLRAGGLPVHVVVVAEGAEEVGSPGLGAVLTSLRDEVRPALVLVSDTRRRSRDQPAVTVSQRGSITLDVEVDTAGVAVHPGRWGGAVIDPTLVLCRALDSVARAVARDIPHARERPEVTGQSDASVRSALGRRATAPDALDERITRRPSVHVTRMTVGGAVSAVPVRARARLDLRIPPGVRVGPAVSVVGRSLDGVAPHGVTVRVEVLGQTPGIEMAHPPAILRAVGEACRRGFGSPPAPVRSGGSLPAAAMLHRAFGVSPVLLGLGPEDDGAHGPNEYLDLAGLRRGILTSVELLGAAGGLLQPGSARGKDARIGGVASAPSRSVTARRGRVPQSRSGLPSVLASGRGRHG
jgi:succinyl-diaminopimelate desuccinylase